MSPPHSESPTAEDIDAMERQNGHRDYVRCLTAWCRALMYERDAARKTIESQERHEPQDSTR